MTSRRRRGSAAGLLAAAALLPGAFLAGDPASHAGARESGAAPLACFTDDQLVEAVGAGVDSVRTLTRALTEDLAPGLHFPLAPHADYTHFHRTRDLPPGALTGGLLVTGCRTPDCIAARRAESLARGLPVDEQVGIAERSLVTLADLVGRSSLPNRFPILKHFPGGPAELELTEAGLFVMDPEHDGLEAMERGYLRPFVDAIDAMGSRPFGIMVGHGAYPRLVADLGACSECRDIASCGEPDADAPASLSPLIVRCLLQRMHGFRGYVIPDWYDMASARAYAARYQAAHEELSGLSLDTVTFILGVRAGVHFFPGLRVTVLDRPYLRDLHDTDSTFRALFDDLLTDKLNVLARCFGHPATTRAEVGQLLPFDIRVNVLVGDVWFDSESARERYPFLWSAQIENHRDVWDRSNEIHDLFRRAVLARLYGKPTYCRRRSAGDDPDNLEYLQLSRQMQETGAWEELAPVYQQVAAQGRRTRDTAREREAPGR